MTGPRLKEVNLPPLLLFVCQHGDWECWHKDRHEFLAGRLFLHTCDSPAALFLVTGQLVYPASPAAAGKHHGGLSLAVPALLTQQQARIAWQWAAGLCTDGGAMHFSPPKPPSLPTIGLGAEKADIPQGPHPGLAGLFTL